MKPTGFSLEIGRDDRGWFVYIGRLKLLHIRPTRHEDDKSWFRLQIRNPYAVLEDHRQWKNARYGGLKLDLVLGKVRFPVPKFWKKEFWSQDYMVQEPATNPFNSGKHWFVLSLLTFIWPFICFAFPYKGERQPGFYLGAKTYHVNEISQGFGRYDIGNPEVLLEKAPYPLVLAWGKQSDVDKVYLCLTGSVRLTDMVD